MKIPFADIKRQYHSIQTEVHEAINEVLNDTAFVRGKYVNRFEENFSQMYGVKNVIGVGNGTDAIYLALRALDIGPGDEVITVCNSWISTSEVIGQVGATVKFIDIESDNFNIDVNLVEREISEKTKAIIPVHLYGQPVKNFDKLVQIAEKYSLYIIEDCALPVVVSSETPLTSFNNSLYSLCIIAVKSPPSSSNILGFQSGLPTIVCLIHHRYSSSVSPFHA